VLKRPLLISALLLSASAHAWNATGHMVIACIAERNLKTEVRLEAERLLKIGATDRAYDFITAAPWADDVRTQRQETGPWHYVDFHFRTDGKRTSMKPDAENALVAIDRMLAILKDRSKPELERADALRYIIHFVGDIHQPLHTTARDTDQFPEGDRGGNELKIQTPLIFSREARPPTNLHALWDRGVGLFPDVERPLTPQGRLLIETQAVTLMAALPSPGAIPAPQMRPELWALEGHEYAKRIVYRIENGEEPTLGYIRLGQSLAARRAVMAGYRLAQLLNRSLER
jgi:hypothetical protein